MSDTTTEAGLIGNFDKLFGSNSEEVFNLIFDSVQKKINFDSISSKFFHPYDSYSIGTSIIEFINEFSNLSARIGLSEYTEYISMNDYQ